MKRVTPLLAVALLSALVSPVSGGQEAAAATTPCQVVDHRGHGGGQDDNTVEGQTRDAKIGATTERDVLGVIGGVVLFHEHTWQPKTTGTGTPWNTTLAYAKSLFTSRLHHEVPSIGEANVAVKRNNGRLLDEIHAWSQPGSQWKSDPSLLRTYVASLHRYGLADQTWVTGVTDALAAVHKIDPDLTLVYRADTDESAKMNPTWLNNRGIDGVQIGFGMPVQQQKDLRAAGFFIFGRQTPPENWHLWWERNVFRVQTDVPGDYLRDCRAWYTARH